MDYQKFIKELDKKLEDYFASQASYLVCKKGCADCCKAGDYPLSDLELQYLMLGYQKLDAELKLKVQERIKNMQKGGECPFLNDNLCSVYDYRPIICRVHGLAYLCKDKTVKLPYCINNGKNYISKYQNGEFIGEPILENLDTNKILEGLNYNEIRNLYDWCHPSDN